MSRRRRNAATIVDWLVDKAPPPTSSFRLADMSEPSKTWVDRMWHAIIDPDVSDATCDELNKLFLAYLDTLDEDERGVAGGTLYMLLGTLEGGDYPSCEECGAPLCPHCGERYRKRRPGH